MTIFCVGGVSGSGKTTLINSHHILQHLPCWDIADYYRAAEEAGRSINPRQACKSMMYHISCYLRRYPAADIVVEAAFAPEGEARERVLKLAQRFDEQIVLFLWCHASRQQCYDRVYEQWTPQDTEQRQEFRLKFIDEAPGMWFCGRRGENPLSVLRDYENGLYDY